MRIVNENRIAAGDPYTKRSKPTPRPPGTCTRCGCRLSQYRPVSTTTCAPCELGARPSIELTVYPETGA